MGVHFSVHFSPVEPLIPWVSTKTHGVHPQIDSPKFHGCPQMDKYC